jgi:glycosyltransferase involved in cell wall biosynthesis
LKVAIFTDNDFGKVNGVTTTLRACLRFAPPDIQLRVYTSDAHGVDTPDYLALRSWGMGIPFYREMQIFLPRLSSLLRHARRDGIDVVHLTTPGPIGLAALWVARRLNVPLVGSFHTDLARYATLLSGSARLGWLMGQFLRWPYGRCVRVLVPSVATAEMLRAARIGRGHYVIWARGVDTREFTPARRSAALRADWGADASTPVVIYAGRVSREKNLAVLPEIEARLRAAGLPYRLVIVGDGPMRRELQGRLPSTVFTGSVPHDRMAEYLASADVFAFPSRTDTAGNVVLEAQACGLPAVVTDEGGPREHVSPGQSALVTDGRSPASFVAAVEALVRDAEARSRMALAAREFACTRDWTSSLEPLFRTYREVAARLPARALSPAPAEPQWRTR